MGANLGITRNQLIAALKSSAAIPGIAAEKLGCSRVNVVQRIRSDPDLQAICADIEQTITDQAQANVVVALQEKQPGSAQPTKEAKAMSKWWLERKGRDRGFTTRTELTNPDGSPLQLAAAPAVVINVRYVEPGPAEDVV